MVTELIQSPKTPATAMFYTQCHAQSPINCIPINHNVLKLHYKLSL